MVNFTNRSINNNNNENDNRSTSSNVKLSMNVHKSSTSHENRQKMKGASMKKTSEFDGTNKTMTGRNTFAFWTIVWLIFVLAVGNLCLTLTIYGVLRPGKGIEFLEVSASRQRMKIDKKIIMFCMYFSSFPKQMW